MSQQLVLVTGATGHLGFRTLVFTLQHGFRARVALRRLEQAERLKLAASLKPFIKAIEFVQVPDITADGAYDEAIKGVDFVIHVASPIYSGFGAEERDWQRLLYDPAEKGVVSILSAAAKEPKVKRVVMTSSVAAIEPKNGSDRAGPYDLKDVPPKEVLQNAPVAGAAYAMSKVLSHYAATEYVKNNSVQYDLVRVLPGYIQGANELYTSAEAMRDPAVLGSNEGTMFTALGLSIDGPGGMRPTSQVFLDDVAKAHVVALKAENVKNLENLLVQANGGTWLPWAEIAKLVKKLYPDEVKKGVLKPGSIGQDRGFHADVKSSEEALGFTFAGPEVYVTSVVDQYLGLLGA